MSESETKTTAVDLVDELIEHVNDELEEIESVLDWNRKIGHRSDSKLKIVRQVYKDQVLCWLNQLRDKMNQLESNPGNNHA